MMSSLLFSLLLTLVHAATPASDLPFYTENDFTPVWKGEFKKDTALASLPAFKMKNQKGQTISEATVRGKITVLNFFYASCGSICPGMMTRLQKVNEKLTSIKNVEMLSFTITPVLDTPEKLAAYAKERHLDLKRWSLLTGEDKEIRKVEAAFKANKDVPSKMEGESVHSENIYLMDQEGRIRGIYNASSWADLDLLVGDIKVLSASL